MTRRHAMFVSAGDRHLLHRNLGVRRDFDLLVAWYGSDEATESSLRNVADNFVCISGGKFQNLRELWRSGRITLDTYESVLVADDDLHLEPARIEHLFRRREELDAAILAPSQSPFGRVSHPELVCRPWWDHHITNFIEENTPIFRTDLLVHFLQNFDGSLSAWGLDHWYMNVLGGRTDSRFVVDDSVMWINPSRRTGRRSREVRSLGANDHLVSEWRVVRDRHGFREIEPEIVSGERVSLSVACWRTSRFIVSSSKYGLRHPLIWTSKVGHYSAVLARRVRRRWSRWRDS